MELRPELSPPVIPSTRIEQLCAAIHTVVELLESGADARADIAAFNEDTGHTYEPYDFMTYGSWRNIEEFALEAARPAWPKVPDVSREELVEIVRRIQIQAMDDDRDYYLLVLETNTVRPGVSDLIHWPPPHLVGASAEAIVDEALRYRPTAL
ncbi:hypothetical protein GCM10009827_119220 [Dactylosporangium maewongense]|uniref:Uncharacterized protein n=1 Tax=Dactylosporangium maewongense TaxID=634393 RepID=A0ABP4PG55_9ACTN